MIILPPLFQMLALSVLDSVLSFDIQKQWLNFMTSKGYIQHIVDSILTDDEQLRAALNPHPEPLRALYIYESKMVCSPHRLREFLDFH